MTDTIDISPEAVEHLCAIHEGYEQHGTAATLRALSAALTQSRAETAAAFEAAAQYLENPTHQGIRPAWGMDIRALATPDQSSALAAIEAAAEARGMRKAAEICVNQADIWLDEKAPIAAGIRHTYANARNAILAAIPAVTPPAQVKVKPLVWVQSSGSHIMDSESDTVPSGYTVRYAYENGWKWQASGIGAYGWEPSPALAKAAAQADYTARIMSAIEPTPDPRDEVIARLVEAGSWLSVCAQTTGGTAGRDDDLVNAISGWTAALAAAKAVQP